MAPRAELRSPPRAAAAEGPLDRVLRIDTPEQVSLELPLAGPGSRFAALLVDGLVLIVAGLAVGLPIAWAGSIGLFSSGLVVALLAVLGVALFWGYFFAFEAFAAGQTPGKRLLRLRVVQEGGHPLSLRAAAVRNLLRIVDLQPGTLCLLGGLSMLVDSRGRRLGDLAAGSVVVRDLPLDFPPPPPGGRSLESPRLADEAYAALESFVERAEHLSPQVRRRLGERLADSLRRFEAAPLGGDPGAFLEQFYAEERRRRIGARRTTELGTPSGAALLDRQRGRWEALRADVAELRRLTLARTKEERVAQFAARYREAAADLARARTYGASARTLFALEHLLGSAHHLFYRREEQTFGRLLHYLTAGFPRLVRRLRAPLTVAAVLFGGSALFGFALVIGSEDRERLLVPAVMIERAEHAQDNPQDDYRDTWQDVWMGSDALSGFLMANNIQVALLAFAGGLAVGLGSAVLLVLNGLHLGTAFAAFANRGVLDNILAFVAPHGAIELTAIAIAGGAGLWLGSAIWFPGRAYKSVALVARAREAASCLGGVILLLVLAGLIEGFVSPARLPDGVKLLAGAVAALWLSSYLGFAGRVGVGGARATPAA
jgi:uncharacterized membrane protein SpoIIM required for sporulation/uncharacterized RDD family membrane protein YckC